jgi:hypothetical protein
VVSGEWAAVVREGTRLEVGWLEEGSSLGLGFGRSGFWGSLSLFLLCSQDPFWDSFFGGILFGQMADNGWTIFISQVF